MPNDLSKLFSINPDLDRKALAKTFKSQGNRLQIADVLNDKSAALLHATLLRNTPWGFAWFDGTHQFMRNEEARAKSPQDFAALNQSIMERARAHYTYLYYCYPMLQAYLEKWHPDHVLMRFLEFLNSAPMLELVREISGLSDLFKADAQATFFGPSHFLLRHSDDVPGQHRRMAYVFGFSKDWREDWGGYLQFFKDNADMDLAMMPRFNVLSIFTTDHIHSVGQVAPFATAPRLSITGWFRDQ
ncbi:2OG-Fe(II) oxygenase [Iodidimonas gelatinilytica]|uniref:2OG-Fe(II) oxygenase n=1 Tax=Iodidimonas gelatinilytica TaxID=1236966 RepID=A0A5A7MWF3_9PROT|nr:2OG-Fe(II) oxygenase family protein [Iodidimonas gelatinilytica]GEQ99804.1 2OG-Fe(II) oxygenase [Iodidimonas gelatinilytica]